MFKLFSINSSKIRTNQIKSICLLKDTQWKYGIKSQMKWFRKNKKKNDIHNLLYINSRLVGYTALKIRTYRTQNLNKKAFYILFDTLVIDKKYRNKKLSNLLMIFNNTVISQSGYFAFLMCKKELVNFYKKNKWVKLNNKTFKVVDHLHYTCGMVFNMKKITKKNYFYINR